MTYLGLTLEKIQKLAGAQVELKECPWCYGRGGWQVQDSWQVCGSCKGKGKR